MPHPPLQRILYIEDEPDIQAVARVALEVVGGFELRICSSGRQALAEAAGFAPDLLLLDVMMPDMDGPTTLRELRSQAALATIPALFLTAKVQAREIDALKRQGAIDVISKPFDPMTLAGRLQAIWAEYQSAPTENPHNS